MARSLYDVLELSQQASAEAIRAAYERLSSKHDPDNSANQNNADARLQHIAVKEAFFRLGNPEKRKQYDLSLQAKSYSGYMEEIPPFWTLGKIVVLALVLLIGTGLYVRDQRHEKLIAAQKIIAEEKRKEAEALAKAEYEKNQVESIQLARERADAARAQSDQNQFRQYNDRVDRSQRERAQVERQQEMSERQRTAQSQREEQSRQSQLQREQQAADAQARRQAADEQRKLQELENQRGGGKVIVIPR